jgi:hypothetical protein
MGSVMGALYISFIQKEKKKNVIAFARGTSIK